MARDTTTPEENDPAWEELGRTRVVKTHDAAASLAKETQRALAPGKNALMAGDRLGDFQLQRKLGEGAMGEVFLAEQASFNNRLVALKILFPHVASIPKLVKRLEREGHVMFNLNHPNIIQSYGMDPDAERPWVSMEYVSGQNTQKWLNQLGKLPVPDAIEITLECARALLYAHELNIVHRDIKPDNIMLTKDGVVKLADLGMVKIHDEEMSLTQTGFGVGTPWYMPLEQAKNAKEIDGRSDIYALGCTLYAFLTGLPPFVGKTIVDVISAKDIGHFPPARASNSAVPERLDLILIKMVAKHPKHRYQSCAELIKDLESLNLAGKPISFLNEKPITKEQEEETVGKMQATVETTLAKSRADATPTEIPTLDPNLWYLQVKTPVGKTARRYTTAQLQKMLADGVIKPNAKISRSEQEGFRAVATFKEFQGHVLGKTVKTGADKQTARSRNFIKKMNETEREREKKERADDKDETQAQATARYWISLVLKGLPIGLGIVFFVCVLYWVAGERNMDGSLAAPLASAAAFFASLVYVFFGRR